MKFREIVKGLGEDIEQIKKARKTGQFRRDCENAKKYGTYKERVIACGLSRILSHKSKKKGRRTKRRKCNIKRRKSRR